MELSQLRCVEAVVRLRHFTLAAEELHVAQSALSQQVRRLEHELQTPLFERTSRRVRPTEAGEAVAACARRVFAEIDLAREQVDDLRGVMRGRIRIGPLVPAGTVDVPGLLARFSREHPGIEVSLIEGTAADMVSHLANDELDVAFCLLAGTETAGLAVEQIGHDEVVAIFAPDVAPARADVSVSDLEANPVIALRRGSAITSVVEGLFGREGSRLTLTLESGDPFLLRSLAARGFATAIVPRSLTALEGPPIEVRSLRPVVRLPVALVWRGDRTLSPAASRFIHHVREEIDGTGRRRRTERTVGA